VFLRFAETVELVFEPNAGRDTDVPLLYSINVVLQMDKHWQS